MVAAVAAAGRDIAALGAGDDDGAVDVVDACPGDDAGWRAGVSHDALAVVPVGTVVDDGPLPAVAFACVLPGAVGVDRLTFEN